MKKTPIRRFLSSFIIFVICLGVLVTILLYFKGEWRFNYEVSLDKLEICQYSLKSNIYQVIESRVVLQDIENIYICGTIKTSSSVDILYIVENMNNDDLVFIESKKVFQSGIFNVLIDFESEKKPGDYRIRVYFERNLLAEQEFSISGAGD